MEKLFDDELIRRIGAEFPRAERDAWGRRRVFLDNGTGTLVSGVLNFIPHTHLLLFDFPGAKRIG